jgi:hypothetical protein
MWKWVSILGILALSGCDGPSPGYRGIHAQRISVGKSTFDVRIKGNRAEAVRQNVEYAPRPAAVAPRAVAAIEKVSGCEVTKLTGDQAQFFARLKCGRGHVAPVLPDRIEYECEIDDHYTNQGLGQQVTEMSCEPVAR